MKKIIENVKKGSKKVYGWCKNNPEIAFMAGMLFTDTVLGVTTIAYNKHCKKISLSKQHTTQSINDYGTQQYQRGQYAGRGAAKNAFINYMVGQGKTYEEALDVINKLEYVHWDSNMKI